MIGTYIYMAPERIDADNYTLNSDIWSLGIIVMECILGYYPYIIYNNNTLPNSVWIVHELIENNPVPPLNSEIYSKELIDFIKQCLNKDNHKRPNASVLINHPFIQKYANSPKEESKLIIVLQIFLFAFFISSIFLYHLITDTSSNSIEIPYISSSKKYISPSTLSS